MSLKQILLPVYRRLVRAPRLRRALKTMPEIRIILGSGGLKQKGWISTDASEFNLLQPKMWQQQLKGKKVSAFLAEHVWEHLTYEEGQAAFKLCFSALKSGGHLRVAVPDGYFPDQQYIDQVKPGGWGDGSDDHKVLYNFENLKSSLESAGFKVRLLEYYDQQGKFHRENWNADQGMIFRSYEHDERNTKDKIRYTSVIADAFRP